jgi:putative membrane protein (TIGR04086 family)
MDAAKSTRLPSAVPVLSGLLWAAIWLGAGTLLLSILLTGSALEETELAPWTFGVHTCAAFCGGFVAARRAGRKGWYFGAFTGALYMLCVLIISFLAVDAAWSLRVAAMALVTGAAGAVGGMLGVNLRK